MIPRSQAKSCKVVWHDDANAQLLIQYLTSCATVPYGWLRSCMAIALQTMELWRPLH